MVQMTLGVLSDYDNITCSVNPLSSCIIDLHYVNVRYLPCIFIFEVKDVSSSVAMDTPGFLRLLNHLLYMEVGADVTSTDGSPSICELITSDNYSDVHHEVHSWHVNMLEMRRLMHSHDSVQCCPLVCDVHSGRLGENLRVIL